MSLRPAEPLISVVCPVYREAETIREFNRRLVGAMEAIEPPVRFEALYIDDGSDDGSADVLRELCAEDRRLKLLRLSRNFGHQLAITAGFDRASGDAAVAIDTDLQDPPEVIGDMVAAWRDGADVVYGQRTERTGERAWKVRTAKVFYRLVNRLSDIPLPLDTGDFRLMDGAVLSVLQQMREENRYIRGLVSWIGFEQRAVQFQRDPRYAGTPSYSFTKSLRLAVDGLTSFSERPLRLASAMGGFATAIGMLFILWIVLGSIFDIGSSVPGYASTLVVVLFFGGVQLLCIGVLGEYIGRIYRESKGRPLYVLREEINVDEPTLAEQATQTAHVVNRA